MLLRFILDCLKCDSIHIYHLNYKDLFLFLDLFVLNEIGVTFKNSTWGIYANELYRRIAIGL